MILMELGAELLGHDCHFKLHEYAGADLSSKMKNRVMNNLLYASSIGKPEGKKATLDHSSSVEHHSQ